LPASVFAQRQTTNRVVAKEHFDKVLSFGPISKWTGGASDSVFEIEVDASQAELQTPINNDPADLSLLVAEAGEYLFNLSHCCSLQASTQEVKPTDSIYF
jgi:hypothetical protein